MSLFLWITDTNLFVLRLDPISYTVCYIAYLLFIDSSTTTDTDAEYEPSTSSEPHFPTKKELDDLICDLGLTKSGAELLTSRLNEWNLFGNNC